MPTKTWAWHPGPSLSSRDREVRNTKIRALGHRLAFGRGGSGLAVTWRSSSVASARHAATYLDGRSAWRIGFISEPVWFTWQLDSAARDPRARFARLADSRLAARS